MSASPGHIRNLGIVAHINAGKTTLSERILYDSGRVRFLGEVDEGTAALDYLPEEQRRGISIRSASTSVPWRGRLLNLVDTPGHVDFGAEVVRCLRVVDGVVLVLDGVRGVEPRTEAVWQQVRTLDLAALAFVNKLDRPVASWRRALDAVVARLGVRALPAVVPIAGETGLTGLIDVVTGKAVEWAPGGTAQADPARARADLVEAAAEFDPAGLEAFAHDLPVGDDALRAALRAGVVRGQLVLVFAGSALHNRGVDLLLDGIADYLPSPLDRAPVVGTDGAERAVEPDAPACALVFKSQDEGGAVWLATRVYTGRIAQGAELARSDGGAPVRVGAIARMHADEREPIAEAGPGDIVALQCQGEPLPTGVTLFAPGHPITLLPARFPEPVLSVAIEPRRTEDLAAVEAAARRLVAADPTLALRRDEARGVLLLSGIGELHLEIAAEELRATAGDRFRVGRPVVACRETITRAAAGSGEWRVAEVGGRAHVRVQVFPQPDAGPARVVLGEGVADDPTARALVAALTGRLATSLCEGWPAFDMVLQLDALEGEVAPGADLLPLLVEASEVALRRALADAGPVVLEPLQLVDVSCPQDALSAVLGDLRGKHVEIETIDLDGEGARVRARAPLARMLGYTTRLRSLTRGLGSFRAEHAGFGPVASDAHG